ncbi:MAG: rhodanese-like domain-containing protein [Thaumarchaeota archaeon]|nr:rhodanese-like domain-containing protein [Nitrososphaerota archaeon]
MSLIRKDKSLLIYDIRTTEKLESGHVEGSTHTACDFSVSQTSMPDIPRDIKIIIVDEHGTESSELAVTMRSLGYDSYFLKDGIKSWKGNIVQKIPGEIHSTTFCTRCGS